MPVTVGRCTVWILTSTPGLFVLSEGLAKLLLLFLGGSKYRTSWRLALESVSFPKWTSKCAVHFMDILHVNMLTGPAFF